MDVLGELIVRPTLDDDEIDGERAVIVEEIRSYLDDPAEYAQILFQQAMFGDGPLGREICGDEAGIRALPAETIRDFWRPTYRPANTVVAVAGDIAHDEAVELASAAFGTGNGVVPGVRAGARAAGRPAVPVRRARDTTQAQLVARRPGASAATTPTRGPSSVLNAVLGDGMSSRLFLSVREEHGLAYDVSLGPRRLRRRRRARGLGRRRPGAAAGGARGDPRRARPAPSTSPCPADELAKAKAYLSGGLELRMDETRHLASWIGGQEALHDRVLTLEEALAEVAAVDARRTSGGSPTELFRDEALRLAVVAPARYAARPRAPPEAAGVTSPVTGRPPTDAIAVDPDERRARPASSPGSTCAWARWASPGPSWRRWPVGTASTRRHPATSPRRAGGRATWPAPARRPRPTSRRTRTTSSAS